MLSKEEINAIKEQIIKQIEENFPSDKKKFAKEQINSMDSEELESFLKKNNIKINEKETECVFCSIVSGKIPSYIIGENKKAIAVLEINPISKAHSLIIPKNHESDLNEKEIKELEEELIEKIKTKFNPKEIKSFPTELFGHKIINLLPIYKDENIKSTRIKAFPEDLEEVQKELAKKIEKQEKIKKPKKVTQEIYRLPKRIP
jgi:diadenosine tetraphosphate (Ap4A) HIT family hydrolase